MHQISPMKVAGSLIVRVLRREYKEHGIEAARDLRTKAGIELDEDRLRAVCEGKATIEGVSPNLNFVELEL